MIGWQPGYIHSVAHLCNNVVVPRFPFKMANIMIKTQQDKMAFIFLIVDVFGSLNMEIDAVCCSVSAGYS